jgi:hypothetical protein
MTWDDFKNHTEEKLPNSTKLEQIFLQVVDQAPDFELQNSTGVVG